MKKYALILLLAFLVPLFIGQSEGYAFAQESEDTTEVVMDTEEDNVLASSSMWNLVGQAGNIRYPIFAILIIGLFLIGLKAFDLYQDRQKSNSLINTPFPDLNLSQMIKAIERQSDNMLSRVMAKLLNVFQTNKNADYLHDEISNYSRLQQSNFTAFKNRIDFLSDTAGALGLLGTVWGMFIVFSSGNLEKENILAGMGIALMSTLLGLIVSIILNFASTLTEGFFSKRLEQVTDKADEMRFRLIELSDSPESTAIPASHVSVKPGQTDQNNSKTESKEESSRKPVTASNNESKASAVPIPEAAPDKIELQSTLEESYEAGKIIENIELLLVDTKGKPLPEKQVEIILRHNGKVNDNPGQSKVRTDQKGRFSFNWALNENAGVQKAGMRVAEKNYHHVKKEISVQVKAAKPATLQILNNHQAAETGKNISKPIVAVVRDKFKNPVNNISVSMKVNMGNGTFKNGEKNLTARTDENGRVETDFKLGDEPGFNAVDIALDDYPIHKNFQAVGQEITV